MVRFKVIKGSHLLLYVAAAILIIVISTLVLISIFSGDAGPVSAQAKLVNTTPQTSIEAETGKVFASISALSDSLELDPGKSDEINIEILPGISDTSSVRRPSVLIYHTHTHEAYRQVEHDRYVAVEAWRTTDQGHSVVRVGEELARLLSEEGFQVVHDTTDHELNELGTAYTRSLKTLERYTQTFDLYIDLHRDAYIEGMQDDEIIVDGQRLAQLMLLIGNGEGFGVKPYYKENLAFARALTDRINTLIPGLCKDVLVKDGRYNQHAGIFSILVEVGHNENTLQEALNSLPCLADALSSLLITDPQSELLHLQTLSRITSDES